MIAERSTQCEDRLQAVSAAFAEWRRSREKRSPVPENLWRAAADLSPFYSACRIAKALGIDYSKLKRRIEDRKRPDTGVEFIELNAESLFAAGPCSIRLLRPGGSQMEIRVEAARPSLLSSLITAFLADSP